MNAVSNSRFSDKAKAAIRRAGLLPMAKRVQGWLTDFSTKKSPMTEDKQSVAARLTTHADPRALNSTIEDGLKRQRPGGVPSPSPDRWKPEPTACVSVVLGTYNRLASLQLTIESIRSNGYDKPMEIIVIDGGSTDGTPDWLMRQSDIITIIQHNRGPAPVHKRKRSWGYFINLGFRIAQAPWVLMLSDDCLLLPNAITEAESHARSLKDQGRKIGGVAFYFRDWPNDEEPRYFVQHTIGGMLMVNHGFFSKEALETVGYAEEEEFSFYKADSDLCLKIWHAGYEIADCKASFVEHLLLPSELLRTANTQSMNDDRLSLFNRWDGIYEKIDYPDMFKKAYREYSDYTDPKQTSELFRPLYEADTGR